MDIKRKTLQKRRGITPMQRPTWLRKQFEKLFVHKETQLVCRKSNHSLKQICLTRNCSMEVFTAAHDHRLSGPPGSEKLS